MRCERLVVRRAAGGLGLICLLALLGGSSPPPETRADSGDSLLVAPADSDSGLVSSPATDSLPESPPGRHSAIRVGEKLTFTVRYGLIKAGTAVMETASLMRTAGRPSYQIVSTAMSNPMFDGIYRVRDRVLSMMDAESLESLYFEKHLREGKYRADQNVRFDLLRQQAVYHDDKEYAITSPTFDALAAFYRVRTMPLKVGETLYLTSHDNRKNYPIKVTVTGRERVETPAGEFDCLMVDPTLRSGAFFKNEGKLTIWLTDDARRMPVLMRSKLPIGAISVELIEWQRPDREATEAKPAAGAIEPTGNP